MRTFLFALVLSLCAACASAFYLGGTPSITSTFDVTRNSSGTRVFSNNNLTVTNGAGAGLTAAYTTLFHPTGKFIFRMTENVCTTAGNQNCGVGLGSASSSSGAGYYLGADATSVSIFDSGAVWIGNVSIGNGGVTFSPGNTIDVAIDIDGQTIRYSVNGGAFTTAISIPGLTSYNLTPAVTINAPTDAFTFDGTTVGVLAGYVKWNSPTPPPPPQTITSVNLSNSTFTAATANAVVGTVSVTMSPVGPAFTGAGGGLTITGANSGGFHLVGSLPTMTLEASASGTAAGTYSDANIVATQAGVSNSPQQITPSLVGSAGGAVPAPASAAGFSTLVINANFQDPSYANPATWYDCAMSGGTPLWYRAWIGFGSYDGPCGAVTQATDTADGGQSALRIHWEDSYFTGNGPGVANATLIQSTDSSGNGHPMSRGFYLEVVARTDLVGGNPAAWMGLWSLTIITSASEGYEIDGFEECGSNCVSSAIHNLGFNYCAWQPSPGNCGGCPITIGCGFNVTQYHTYAWRQTSAGTDIVFCAYLDGGLEGCSTIQPNTAELNGIPMTHQFGVYNGLGTSTGNGSTGKNTWIKSVKVWSCDTNPANNCNSSSNQP